MVLFKDLNKSSKDLLIKDFPHETPWDLEYKYKGDNINLTNTANVSIAGGLDASTLVKYTQCNVTSEIKVTSGGGAVWDLKQVDTFIEGLSLGSRFERKSNKAMNDSLELSAEYVKDLIHSKLTISPLSPYFNISTCLSQGKLGQCKLAAEISGGADLASVRYSLGASYTQKCLSNTWTFTVKTMPTSDAVFGKVIANIYGNTLKYKTPREIGAEISYSLLDGKSFISFGGLWHLNNSLDTFVKAKVSQDARVALSLTHKFSDAMSATLGTQIDGKNPSNPEALKYGIKLNLSA